MHSARDRVRKDKILGDKSLDNIAEIILQHVFLFRSVISGPGLGFKSCCRRLKMVDQCLDVAIDAYLD